MNTANQTLPHVGPVPLQKSDLPLCCPRPDQPLWCSHPRVFLPIEKTGHAQCPYCGTQYILNISPE